MTEIQNTTAPREGEPDYLAALAREYSALFLDNDGTVVRTEELHAAIGMAILNRAGIHITYSERFAMLGHGEIAIWEALDAEGRTPQISAHEFRLRQVETFKENLKQMQNPSLLRREGILDLIGAFRAAGKPVWIVSNTASDLVKALHKAADLEGLFDGIITAEDIEAVGGQRKPAPDPYVLARLRAGVGREKCLAVEDSPVGVESAVAARCDVIHIYYNQIKQRPHGRAFAWARDDQNLREVFEQAGRHILDEQQKRAASAESQAPRVSSP